jgi:hypothetical protein
MLADLFVNVRIENDKQLDYNGEFQLVDQFREVIIYWCIIVPPVILFVDFLFNKIRIPLRQIWFTILVTGLFFLINWNCRENYSYLLRNATSGEIESMEIDNDNVGVRYFKIESEY